MPSVLIVDDEKSIRRTLGEFLRAAGYEVEEAEDADAAQQRLSGAEFDVVVTDIILPRVSGVELLHRIQAAAPRVQVVMMTGEPTVETATESLRAGAADYLFKPITKDAILRVVAGAVRIKSLADAKQRLEAENRAYRENLEQLVQERTAQLQQSEEALRESERKYRMLFEGSRDAILTVDPATHQFLACNPGAANMFGAKSEAVVIACGPAHFSPERQPDGRLSSEAVQKIDAAVMEKGELFFEWTHRRLTGEKFFADVLLTRIRWDNRPIIMATVRDITERKRAEEERARLAAAIEQAAETIIITDTGGTILYVNPAFEKLTGYTRSEAQGLNPRLLKSGKHDTAFYKEMWRTLTQGEVWRGHLINKRKDGTLYEESATISPIRNAAGRIVNYVGIRLDVTREKQLEAQFLRAQRLESVGALASGIAHDLNNILSPMLIAAPLLHQSVTDAECQTLLETIEESAQRGTEIIKQLLTFARGKPEQRVPVPLRHLARDMEKIVSETFPRQISPKINWALELWPVVGDPTQLHQVLLNLCVNARDAMPEGGQLVLAARNVTVETGAQGLEPEAQPGPYVCLSVSDTGTGIPPELVERIFDPFFTTKEIGKGTGLGLATVLGIVRGHKGFIRVHSQLGRGTTFELYFPASPELETTLAETPKRNLTSGQGQLILVVEDETGVRGSLRRILEKFGYRVLLANQGAEGIALFKEHQAEIAAVVTDVMMPVMGGVQMVQAIRALAPSVPVLVMTGLMEQENWQSIKALDATRVINKPFFGEALLAGLAELLGGAATWENNGKE